MTDVLNLVKNRQSSEFYPTPEILANKMLEGLDMTYIQTVLEPSAGKGDLIMAIAQKAKLKYCGDKLDVDCIEIDPNLRQILKYNFSEERESDIRHKISELDRLKNCWNGSGYENRLTKQQKNELFELESEKRKFLNNRLHIVHDDFLTYEAFKHYDLILMNPPFSNGDKHLLKALEIQKNGGNVICLLNAETLNNAYTPTRNALVKKLAEYNADIQYISNAFIDAERSASVDVALIKVAIPSVQEESEIFNKFKKAQEYEDFVSESSTELEVSDYIQAAINLFKVEVKSGMELIRQYRALAPYISNSFNSDGPYDKKPILRLTDNYDRDSVSVNSYLKTVRSKYWRALLSNQKFMSKLTSKLQEEYRSKVSALSAYDFTEYNIKILTAEINSHIKRGVEEEIITMFDRLTKEHSWYPETRNNRHYYDGWATNKAHKIDKKVIIPCYGIFSNWDGKPSCYEAYKCLADIERILNFLDGNMTQDVDMDSTINGYFANGITKKLPLKYFEATFYKKGTVHLIFTCPELIERFNIYAAQNKAWLPPCYGKKQYKDMTDEEKTVIDGFQGEEAYNKVLERSDYYLAPATNNQLLRLEG